MDSRKLNVRANLTNEDLHKSTTQGVSADGVLCPHCAERFVGENLPRCPICYGDLRAVESLREHVWRNHDDRVDVSDFERWLAGKFEIEGLHDPVVERLTPVEAPSSDGHANSEDSAPDARQVSTRERSHSESALEVDEAGGVPPSRLDGNLVISGNAHEVVDAHDAQDDWPPQFSPGLRINFRAQPIEAAPGGVDTRGNERTVGPESRTRGRTPDSQTFAQRGKPPVLIVDGPGPVMFAGRPARSVIVASEQVLIGRSAPDGSRRVDIDLSAYHRYDRLIARRHARVYFDRGLWFIEDFADNDATFLHGRPKPLNLESVPLRDGDKILIGDSIRLRFHAR